MDINKKIRIPVDPKYLAPMIRSLSKYVEYATSEGFQHSIGRTQPVLEYVQKKEKGSKSEDQIMFMISLKDLGTVHDALSDDVVYHEGDAEVILPAIQFIEESLKKKMIHRHFRTRKLATYSLLDVKRLLEREGR